VLHVLLVFIGGGLGSVLRHALSAPVQAAYGKGDPSRFPLGTLVVNVIGCLLIGLLAAWCGRREPARLLVLVGVLGGFTTFSTFGLEAVRLLSLGHLGKAAVYVLATNAAALAAVWIGYGDAATASLPAIGAD
jgi:CrcB protein